MSYKTTHDKWIIPTAILTTAITVPALIMGADAIAATNDTPEVGNISVMTVGEEGYTPDTYHLYDGPFTENLNYAQIYTNKVVEEGEAVAVLNRSRVTQQDDTIPEYEGEDSFFGKATDPDALTVSFEDAWDSGAHAWDADKRWEFMMDPMNRSTGMQINDPIAFANAPKSYGKCDTAKAYIAVKSKYRLSVVPTTDRAVGYVLNECGATDLDFKVTTDTFY